jgi:ribosomal protein S18 acetylase RimI-like enzyme
MVVVRRITEADIGGFREALDAVARESNFLRGNEAPPIEAVSSFVLGNLSTRNPQFVAVAKGRIVGWCDIVRAAGMHERHLGELGMGILAEWRGRGIGRRLLIDTVDAADAENFLRIELSVHSDNVRAIKLYRDYGFAEEGRKIRARLKGGMPVDVVMMARLRPDAEWPLNATAP